MEDLLPVLVVGIGALLFSKQGSAATVNPYASNPNSASYVGSSGMPYLNGSMGAGVQPSVYGSQPSIYGAQPMVYGMQPAYGYYPQNQTGNSLINLATGVINKLPNNILANAASDAIVGGSTAAATTAPIASGSVVETVLPSLDSAAADAAVSSAVDTSVADAATSSAVDAVVADAGSSWLETAIADWGWAAW